jgi:hypothetical protein
MMDDDLAFLSIIQMRLQTIYEPPLNHVPYYMRYVHVCVHVFGIYSEYESSVVFWLYIYTLTFVCKYVVAYEYVSPLLGAERY